MTQASSHNKKMEDLMGAEEFVMGIEQGKLQRINDAADRVNDAPCQKPQKSCSGKGVEKLPEYKDTYPAHGDIDQGGEPFGTGDPECLDQHTDNGNAPDYS